jgi:hypothetical protein
MMSARLIQLVDNAVIKTGGVKGFSEFSGLAERTVRNIQEGKRIHPKSAYTAALACEPDEAQALALAREYLLLAKKAG